ncbi:MAG: hypothetical protein ACK4E7_07135 [Permianibacter sp.]
MDEWISRLCPQTEVWRLRFTVCAPVVTVGQARAISAFNMPLANEPFVLDGISYHLCYEAKGIPITNGGGIIGYDADVSTMLRSASVSQDRRTGTQTHVDCFPYPSCEEAKAAVPPHIIFDLVADLDGDGKLDFVYLKDSGGEFPSVYLGSQAAAGEWVRRIDIN